MWRVYKRPRNNEDYTNYKEALNAATTEIKKSERCSRLALPVAIGHMASDLAKQELPI